MAPINPATGEALRVRELHSSPEVERRLQLAFETFDGWRRRDFATRAEGILRLADALTRERESLARMISTEMGKPIREALGEVDKCAKSCRTLVEQFPGWRRHHETHVRSGYTVVREPLGVVLGIMPWNFPLWQAVRFAVPALLCGNTILLKHAPNSWGSAEQLEGLMREALPWPVYQDLRVEVAALEPLIADRRLSGVSLTGSRAAGSSVGSLAGRHLKKCVLELGGSDAYVILDDADVELAIQVCAKSRLINAGQSCVSAKRFIVTQKNHDRFVKGMMQALGAARLGDPLKPDTDVGPLARADLRDQLARQVERSLEKGAQSVYQSNEVPARGSYYGPQVLIGVQPGQPAFDEELFGPVAAVIKAESEAHAFELANRSCYGLGGAIFSRDVERARELARLEMDSGMVFLNEMVQSDPAAPFGGIKDSGLGRELGRDGCFEFTNIKLIYEPQVT